MDLRNALSHICKHLSECSYEEHDSRVISNQPDYLISDAEDRIRFFKGRREGKKRARALLNFEKKDEDDLGFRKNDIIIVLCEKDEHCWIGR